MPALASTLADHDEVGLLWGVAGADEIRSCEERSAGNLKRVWMLDESAVDVADARFQGRRLLDRATQVKTIWIPYGV